MWTVHIDRYSELVLFPRWSRGWPAEPGPGLILYRGPWKPEETSDPSLEDELREESVLEVGLLEMGSEKSQLRGSHLKGNSEWFYIPERESHTHKQGLETGCSEGLGSLEDAASSGEPSRVFPVRAGPLDLSALPAYRLW